MHTYQNYNYMAPPPRWIHHWVAENGYRQQFADNTQGHSPKDAYVIQWYLHYKNHNRLKIIFDKYS